MPSLPPTTTGELFYDGVWNSASVRQTSTIEITRGLSSESDTAAEPMSCECDLNSGREMLYAPRNPESPLFGKIGRNTPFRLSLEAGGPYLACPPTGIYGFTAPDNNAFDVLGDIDLRIDIRPTDWTSPQALTSRHVPGSVNWSFAMGQDGFLYLWWSDGGIKFAKSTAQTIFANGERNVLRATLDVDNGAGGWTARFWWSKDLNAEVWTQIGDDVSDTGTTSLPNVDAELTVADNALSLLPDSSSGTDRLRGELYGFQLWDGFNDRLIIDMDIARDGVDNVGGTSFVDSTGFTWTRSGVSSLDNKYYRAVGEIPSWPPTRDLTGNDVVTSIAPTGITRRMDSGNKPIDSALLRWLKDQSPLECWPCTDGQDRREGASLVGGRGIVNELAGIGEVLGTFGTDEVVNWVEPIYTTEGDQSNSLVGLLPSNTSGDWTFDMIVRMSGLFQPFNRLIIKDDGAGTSASPRVTISVAMLGGESEASGRWFSATWEFEDDGGSSQGLIWSPNFSYPALFDGEAHHVRLTGSNTGTTVLVDLYVDGEFLTNGSVPFEMGTPRSLEYAMIYSFVGTHDDGQNHSAGFITYWDGDAADVDDFYNAFQGFPGETTSERILRLAAENNYTASISGIPEDEATLSLQERQKLPELLQTASDANFGYLLERRDELEIYHRGQSTLWNQAPVITLDFADGVIGRPFKPVDDDKLTENDVTVKPVRGGSPSRHVLEEGELSVQDFPNGVGRYDQEYEYIFDTTEQANNAAYMKLHRGTFNGVRYTRITLDLANKRVYAMLHKILRADVGDKIRLLNVPKDHGPGPVDVIIQGYTETIGPEEWRIVFNCAPGEPWTAGQIALAGERDAQSWVDTAGCVTGGTADTTQDQIDLFTTATWHWTSDLSDSPYDVRVGGEVMTVLGPAGPLLANPLFDTNVDSWGGQNGAIVWTDEIVHPHPRARGSLKITPTGGFSAGGPLSDLSAVDTITPGVSYSLGAWIYSVNGFSDFRVVADWYDAAGAYLSTSGATIFPADARTWTFVTATAAAPVDATRYRMRVRYGALADADDVYYVWAARLTLPRASAILDTFTRTEADTWGTSDSGNAWSSSGGAASDYDTTGAAGTHSVSAVNSSRYSIVEASHLDQDVLINVSTPALALTASQYVGAVARFTDFDNNYSARLEFQTDQDVILAFNKRVGAAQEDIASVTLPWDHAVDAIFAIRFQVQGSTLRAKAWPVATTTEPTQWHLEATDADLPDGDFVGVRSTLGSGNTNTLPFLFSYWEFETVNNQKFSVTRSENNVVKSHEPGEPAMLAVPSYVQM